MVAMPNSGTSQSPGSLGSMSIINGDCVTAFKAIPASFSFTFPCGARPHKNVHTSSVLNQFCVIFFFISVKNIKLYADSVTIDNFRLQKYRQ